MNYPGRYVYLFLAFAGMSFLYSCVKDSGNPCHVASAEVTLEFIYDMNIPGEDRFGKEVEMLDLLILDDGNNIISMENLSVDRLDGRSHKLELEKGDYTIVVWGNAAEQHYDMAAKSRAGDYHLKVRTDEEGNAGRPEASLFHAAMQMTVTNDQHRETVSLTKFSNQVAVVLNGLDPVDHPEGEQHIKVRIEGDNGAYGADGNVITGNHMTYLPRYGEYETSSKSLQADFTVFRITAESDIRLVTEQPGYSPETFDLSLPDLIREKYTGEDFGDYLLRQDSFVINVHVAKTRTGQYILTKIQVNDWDPIIFDNAGI